MADEIRWTALEFEHHEKGFLWEAGIIFGAAILVIVALLWQQNFLFAVFIGISATTLIFWGRQRPKELEFVLDKQGLAIGDHHRYGYDELAEFALSSYEVTADRMMELILHKKSAASTNIKMFVPSDQADAVRERLSEILPEFEYRESMVDSASRLFRF